MGWNRSNRNLGVHIDYDFHLKCYIRQNLKVITLVRINGSALKLAKNSGTKENIKAVSGPIGYGDPVMFVASDIKERDGSSPTLAVISPMKIAALAAKEPSSELECPYFGSSSKYLKSAFKLGAKNKRHITWAPDVKDYLEYEKDLESLANSEESVDPEDVTNVPDARWGGREHDGAV